MAGKSWQEKQKIELRGISKFRLFQIFSEILSLLICSAFVDQAAQQLLTFQS